MDRELAKHVVSVALKSMGELSDLLELIKNHCDATEYAAYVRAVAAVSGEIATQIVHRALAAHAGLEDEVEGKVKKYGKLI